MKKISVVINGKNISLGNVTPFHQSHPFPGDHRYVMQLEFETEKIKSKFIEQHKLENLKNVNWRIFFNSLEANWPNIESSKSPKYLINSVDSIKIMDNCIQIEGVCSTVLVVGDKSNLFG